MEIRIKFAENIRDDEVDKIREEIKKHIHRHTKVQYSIWIG